MNGPLLTGRRVAALRKAHGESLREAAVRTGVSHTTIARIEGGQATGSLHSTLRKIAAGYGVTVEYLLTGRDPRQEFELSVRRLPAAEQGRLLLTSPLSRIRMLLRFLLAEYPVEFPPEKVADALNLTPLALVALLEGRAVPAPQEELELGERLARLSGLSPHWFRLGLLEGGSDGEGPKLAAHLAAMRKAVLAGVSPEALERALELLIRRTC